MNLDRFVAERSPTWVELEGLVARAGSKPERLGPSGIRKLGSTYRTVVTDLSVAKRSFPGDPVTVRLEALTVRAHGLVYGGHEREGTFRRFITTGFWVHVREGEGALALAAALLFGSALLAFIWSTVDPSAAANLFPGMFSAVVQPKQHGAHLGLSVGERSALASQIFTHNIQLTFLAFVGGITAGLLTAFFLVYNGLLIGIVAGLAVGAGNGSTFVQLVLPHGVLELSCMVVSGSLGFRIAKAVIDPGPRARTEVLREVLPGIVEGALGVALWLVVAGLVEGFITPIGIGIAPACALGFGLAGVFWALVVVRGRRQPDHQAAPYASRDVGKHRRVFANEPAGS